MDRIRFASSFDLFAYGELKAKKSNCLHTESNRGSLNYGKKQCLPKKRVDLTVITSHTKRDLVVRPGLVVKMELLPLYRLAMRASINFISPITIYIF